MNLCMLKYMARKVTEGFLSFLMALTVGAVLCVIAAIIWLVINILARLLGTKPDFVFFLLCVVGLVSIVAWGAISLYREARTACQKDKGEQ